MADRVFSYEFRGSFGNLQAGLTAAQKNVSDLSSKMTALDKDGARMRAGLGQIGDTAGKVGLVAAAGLGAVVLTAAKFDKAMSAVSAVTGESAGNMEKLRQAALDAGAATAFSATEAAAGIENLAKAGVSTSDILGGGLAGALDLAAAGEIGVAEAAEAASKAMTQFGLAGADVPHIADLLAAAAGKATGDVSDFTQALNQSGLVADQVGLSIEETTGGLAAFASAGLLGSDAGTSFKTMLGALTPNSSKAAEVMADLGLNAYDAQGNFVGLAEFAGQLQTALGDMSAEQRQAALETIFGSDAVRAASVLYEQGESGIRDWTAAVDDSGYAAEVAGERLDNLAGDWEEFTGSLETALIGAGEGSQSILRELVQGATGVVNAFNGLPSSAQSVATGLLAITAVTGSAAWFGSKVIQGVANTKQALDDLGISAGKTSGNLGAVAKAGAGLAIVATVGAGIGSAIANLTGANLELEDLDRNLQSIAGGVANAELGKIVDDLRIIGDSEGWVGGIREGIVEVGSLNGFFGTFSTTLDGAQSDIEAVDQRLAALVESGNGDQAAAIFESIVAELNGLPAGSSMSQEALDSVMGKFDSYGTAAENAAAATGEVTEEGAGAAGALDEVGGAADEAAENIKALLNSLDALVGGGLDLAAASDAWAAGLRNLDESLADGTKSLVGNTDAADKNRAAVRDQVSNLLNLVNAQAETGAGAKQLEGQMRRGYDAILAAGKAANISEGDMRAYLKTLGLTPKSIDTVVKAMTAEADANLDKTQGKVNQLDRSSANPKVQAQVSAAQAAIQSVWNALTNLDGKTATTWVTTRRVTTGGMGPTGSAEGGTVPKTGLGYADRHPYLLADGEEVISNRYGQADKHRPLLKAINAGRLAEGGTAGGRPGFGPMNPLYGIGRDFISAGEMAGRLANLTVRQLAKVGEDMERLAKGPLSKLAKAFEKATELAQEELEASKDKLRALKDERDSIAATVESRLKTADLFGQVARPGGFDFASNTEGLTPEQIAANVAAQNSVNAALGFNVASSPVDILRADLARAREEQRMIQQLKSRGLSGSALQYAIEAEGGLSGALSLSGRELRQFENLYNRRDRVAASVGMDAGNAVLGQEIRQQTREVRAQREVTQAIREEARDTNRRLERLERLAEKAPRETGSEVGKAVNGAAAGGQRRRQG